MSRFVFVTDVLFDVTYFWTIMIFFSKTNLQEYKNKNNLNICNFVYNGIHLLWSGLIKQS